MKQTARKVCFDLILAKLSQNSNYFAATCILPYTARQFSSESHCR
ncbi:protein of unknown function [Maridesulfovibrio hydrothermalis AM13 = DSM 14728]|uniref:Uncharacterized protein n=1 Tax=Maridesulfovibrio hydrothermalis AM13 = DSM 14728 TaxID=1121451 RepID=L0RCZ7_9BACT|nr:protein of unknown function [Maridesulfovibrio hydrothermalis AM13 = DSM 14728]